MLIDFLQKNRFFRKFVYTAGRIRAKHRIRRIQSFIGNSDVMLDIGSGTCNISEILSNKGHVITPLDVKDLSFVDNLKPVLYDGKHFPFQDDVFDTSLIITVLHHTPEPELILQEAGRVSRRIILVEDIYSNWFHKYLTYFFDSLMNLEFFSHPHSNKSDFEWKKTFNSLGLKLVSAKYSRCLVFRHAVYFLEK
jgi:ubiquinone/menaquinone biosynthesis C-methylase UbiE